MSELSQLSPQPLWDIFAKICSIPHPSYHEEQLAEHIMGWAKEKGLHATLVATVGYRHDEDDTQHYIKVRKPKSELFETI